MIRASGIAALIWIAVAFSTQLMQVSLVPASAPAVRHKTKSSNPLPIVLWHGFNNSAEGIKPLVNFLEKEIPGVYALSIQIGNTTEEDVLNSYKMDVNKQVKIACKIISQDKRLQKGYNAFGLSQGGLFMRAIVERCPDPPIYNLITLGSPHQGIYGIPRCDYDNSVVCAVLRQILNSAAYDRAFQRTMPQAQYWHDPTDEEKYRMKSTFLADINNERPMKNEYYKKNMLKLKNFVMIKYAEEDVIQPNISEWFGFYYEDSEEEVVELQNFTLYTQDWIGLKQLNDTGRLHFLETRGKHMSYDWEWLREYVVKPFLM